MVRHREGRARALQRLGSRGDRCVRRPRLPGVPRSQDARHPDDRAPRGACGRRARHRLPDVACARRRGDAARRRRRPGRRRGGRGLGHTDRARQSRSSRATTALPSTSCPSGSALQSRAAAAASCARRAMCATQHSSPRGSRSSSRASGRRARRITIRPAPRRRGTHSIRVPICSSSDEPSQRRQTPPQPRLPWSHPSPETPDFSANLGSLRPARANKTSVACRGVRPEKAPR